MKPGSVEEAELFALRGMGWSEWKAEHYPCYGAPAWGVFVYRRKFEMGERWNPRTNLDQAIELANQVFPGWSINKTPDNYQFLGYRLHSNNYDVLKEADNLCDAICDCAREMLKGGRT